MSVQWRLLLLFVAIAIAALVFDRFRSAAVTDSLVAQPVTPPKQTGAPMPATATATVDAPTADPTPSINPALVKGFSTSTNYREFIAAARGDIAHGGGAYAIAAERDCDYVKMVLDAVNRGSKEALPDSRDIVARAEARTLLEARCGTMMQSEVGARTFFDLKRSGEGKLDPLLQLRDQLSDPRFKADRAYRNEVVAGVVETQDPLMWTQYRSATPPLAPHPSTASPTPARNTKR